MSFVKQKVKAALKNKVFVKRRGAKAVLLLRQFDKAEKESSILYKRLNLVEKKFDRKLLEIDKMWRAITKKVELDQDKAMRHIEKRSNKVDHIICDIEDKLEALL